MKLIAIDIGSYSVKLCEAEASFRKIQLINYHEEQVAQTEAPPTEEQRYEALSRILEQINLKQVRTTINIPAGMVTTRHLSLPFSEKRKIELALPFELEEVLPFDIDDLIIDHRILLRSGKTSELIAGMVQKSDVSEFIKALGAHGITPDIISPGSIAISNITPVRFEDYEGTYSIINVGHTNTNITLVQNGLPILARSIPIGGLNVTRELMTAYKVNYEEAERAKIEQGFVLASSELKVTKDQERFSDAIKEALAPLMKEINQTFLSVKTERGTAVDQILLCGGTSLLRNFPAYVKDELHIPTEMVQVLEGFELSQIPVNQRNEAVLTELTGLAIGATSAQIKYQINFRKGDFSKFKREGLLEPQYAYIAKIIFLVLALLFFNMIGKYGLLKTQSRIMKKQISTALNEAFPKLPKAIIGSPQRLKAYVEKKTKSQSDQISMVGSRETREMTPLHILVELSRLTPQNLTVEISSLDIVEEKIKITGIIASKEAAEQLFKVYSGFVNFTDAEKTSVTPTADGKFQEFTFEFKVTV
ncbi:type II secretion system protein GspL [Bdellovibrionota bacterium]